MAESLEAELPEPAEAWLRDLMDWYTGESFGRVHSRFVFTGDLLLAASRLDHQGDLFERVLLNVCQRSQQVRDLEEVLSRRESSLEFLVDQIVEADPGNWFGVIEFYRESVNPKGTHPWQVVVRMAMAQPELAKKLEQKLKEFSKTVFPAGDSSISLERALRAKL